MPWRPLPRIAFAVATYPFQPSSPADLPLELGDELYIIEQGGANGSWYRGYLVAPPSLLAGLTSVKGQTLEARVFSGIFPKNCVEIREFLGDTEIRKLLDNDGRSSSALTNGINGHGRETEPGEDNDGGDREDAVRRRSVATFRSGSVPMTPISISARDPNAPKPAAPVPMLKIGDETPTSYEEPLVDEIASCLREWHSTNLHELLLSRQYGALESMSNIVQELDLARRQLLHDVLTGQEKNAVRQETVWNLVRGNKMLTGEIIVRDPKQRGRLLTFEDSAIELTRLQSEMSMLESDPSQQGDPASLHHLLVEVKAVSGSNSGPVTLSIYLCSRPDNGDLKPLSETYVLDVPSPESFSTLAHSSKLKTLFTELCATDISEASGGNAQLYLVAMVQSAESPRPSLPPMSRSSGSRDGALASRSASTLNSVKGSQKGRRSVMWSPKARTAEPGKENTRNPPRTGDSTSSGGVKDSTSGKGGAVIRTIGVGILDVAPILRQDKDAEQVINIWSPLGEDDEEDKHNEGFDELIRSLLPSPTGRYARSYRASRLHIHLYPFVDSDADVLMRNNPTLMLNVTQTRRMGFPAAPEKPRSDIYLTISRAAFPQDALLSHPQAGRVPVPVAAGFRNLQLTLEVRDASGARLERCIFSSSNSSGHTAWRTTVAERGSSWNQTIRLKIPTDQVPGAHVIMSVADAPEFPFALCWLPLWGQQAFLRNGSHSLLLYAYDKVTSSIDENGKGAYLTLPWSALGKNESAKDEAVTGPLATVQVETNLCSTELSQDQVILGLINWQGKPGDEILELLRRILFVSEIEIVKQLRDVFDALFGILVDNAGSEEYEDLIFNALVTVLGIVHDRRFKLGPLVDQYTEKQFNFPFATPCLVRSYLRLLQASTDSPQQSRSLRAAFKVGRHLLKFILSAREQQKAKEEGIGITQVQPTFNRDIHSIFKSLDALMRNPSPVMVGSKTLVVQHFHTWLPQLDSVLNKDEMIMIALSFMDSCKDVKGMLILYKLVLIQNFTRLSIFSTGTERRSLISSCIGWLDPYWGSTSDVSDQYRDQIRLCSSIVAELSKQPDPELYAFMPKIASSYCAVVLDGVEETGYLSMLYSKSFPFLVKSSNRKQKFDEALVELAGLMAAISKIPNPKLPSLKGDDLEIFLSNALEAHKSIISCEAYPEDWLSVHIYHHRATVKSLEYLSSILIESFLPAPDDADNFEMRLWELFFTTLLKVVSSEALALETFPEQKRRAVWKIGGDVREQGADLLRHAWEAIGWDTTEEERARYGLKRLGGYQVQYVPALVPAIIELCLSVHQGLRRVAVEVLQTMIISEWDLNQDLSLIETEIISSLDVLFQTKHLNESITQKLFIGELLELFDALVESDDGLSVSVKELIATVDELLDLLVACNSGGMSESLHTLRLMEFMKDLDREDIFIRYVHELAQTQAAERNYAEAGLALQFHADLYDWDATKPVPSLSNPAYPEQTAFERKEALYFEMIQHFEDGKAWTHALACYKELADQYEHMVMDFAKLSRAQSSMAKIYESIAKDDKQFPRYFRVCYKGLGFPLTLRDKQFIFEASPTERMSTFTDRMQKQHPAAQIISSEEIEDLEGQFLQITSVSAHRDMGHPVYQRSKIPHSVREHLLISTPTQFSFTSKRHLAGVDAKEQWVEKTVFTTAEPFPNILRRSEIVASEEVVLTPLQTAVERTWRKTQELLLLEQRALSGDDFSLSGLTEALTQLLEFRATPSSCVAMYRVFLSQDQPKEEQLGEDEEEEEEEAAPRPVDPLENALAVALIDHALAIKHSLTLFSRPAYQATQAELMHRFEEAFGPELASLAALPQTQQIQDSPQLSSRSPPLANGVRRADSVLAARSISPEQELIRASRFENNRKHTSGKPSIGHRISIVNPFKRSNHATTGSIATVTNVQGSADMKYQSELKVKRMSMDEPIQDQDDDAATVHSRTTSRSRGGKSEKRRSWFGGESKLHRQKSTASVSEEKRPSNRSRDRSATTMSQSEVDRSQSGNRELEPKKSMSSMTSPDLGAGRTALPRASFSERPPASEGTGYPAKGGVGVTNSDDHPPNGGVRESVMKRFSLLKVVGRKASRLNVGSGGGTIETLHEE
jgi:dedicator of cytokinesis protein 3